MGENSSFLQISLHQMGQLNQIYREPEASSRRLPICNSTANENSVVVSANLDTTFRISQPVTFYIPWGFFTPPHLDGHPETDTPVGCCTRSQYIYDEQLLSVIGGRSI